MNLAEVLMTNRPREASGSISANRFGFQLTWALCHLLQLHEDSHPYVLIMEFHDDVLALDDDVDPKSVEFFQVKTRKDGHWSQKDLLAAPKQAVRNSTSTIDTEKKAEPKLVDGASRSILGKLIEHCRFFLPQVKTLNVVSNANGANLMFGIAVPVWGIFEEDSGLGK